MTTKRRDHIGGQQLPLFLPESAWLPPAELPDLRGQRIAVDFETRDDSLSVGRGPGWAYGAGYIVGVGVAWAGGRVYLPTRHPEDNYREPEQVPSWLNDMVRSAPSVVFQNASYDVGWMKADWGIDPPDSIDDTIAMAVMIDETRPSFSLDNLCRWQGLPGKDETLLREVAAAYRMDPKKDLWRFPARFVGQYGEGDAASTLALADSLWPQLGVEGTERAYRLEMDLVPMVHEMRRRGLRIDVDRAQHGIEALLAKRDEVLVELGRHLGGNPVMEQVRSPKQMAAWFDDAGVKYPYTAATKSYPRGQPSFSAKWMRKHEHWLPRLTARAEQLSEAADKFLQGFILDYAHRGRLHASINQYRGEDGGTRTFRFSYADPPLQQMPHRDEELKELIRGLFLPEDGELFLSADYSQQEYRLIVHYANLMRLPGAAEAANRYRDDPNTDFHQFVADITGLERKPAKDANFAKSYGAQPPKFAEMTGRSVEEAAAIMEQYDRELPFVSRLNHKCDSLAAKRGFIRLLDGARVHFPFYEVVQRRDVAAAIGAAPPMRRHEEMMLWAENFEAMHGWRPSIRRADTRKAMNGLIQGGAARQTKIAMRDCWREGLVPLLQMHDELDFSVTTRRQVELVGEIMRGVEAKQLTVPMKVDLEVGLDWAAVSAAGMDLLGP